MEEFVRSAVNWLSNINWQGFFGVVRAVFIFLDVVLVVAFIAVMPKAFEYRPNFSLHPGRKKKIIKDKELIRQWQLVMEKSAANPPQSLILAIIEADKFVDNVLKKMGFIGEHMADRLEKLNNFELKSLDPLWRAHRVRNELVHQPDYNISSADANEILKVYENFLKEIEII